MGPDDRLTKYVLRDRAVPWCETHPGANYSEEEVEALVAIDAYKRRHHKPFPTWTEILGVLRALGWRKVPASTFPPAAPPAEAPADEAAR